MNQDLWRELSQHHHVASTLHRELDGHIARFDDTQATDDLAMLERARDLLAPLLADDDSTLVLTQFRGTGLEIVAGDDGSSWLRILRAETDPHVGPVEFLARLSPFMTVAFDLHYPSGDDRSTASSRFELRLTGEVTANETGDRWCVRPVGMVDPEGWEWPPGEEKLRARLAELETLRVSARESARRLTAVLIAEASRLDVPFTNADGSPWSLSVKPALNRLRDALGLGGPAGGYARGPQDAPTNSQTWDVVERRIAELMGWCAQQLGNSVIHHRIREILAIPDDAYPWQVDSPELLHPAERDEVTLADQIARLADVITADPREPASEGSAIEVAIRLIEEGRTRNASGGRWAELEQVTGERDELRAVYDAVRGQRDGLLAERDQLRGQRDHLLKAARPWRAQFRPGSYMSPETEALAVVDGSTEVGTSGPRSNESGLSVDSPVRPFAPESWCAKFAMHGAHFWGDRPYWCPGGEMQSCKVTVWDGPYSMVCGRAMPDGECLRHGRLASSPAANLAVASSKLAVLPESVCGRCRGPNRVWWAPSPLWNQVMRGGDIGGAEAWGIICPTCFVVLAEQQGIAEFWKLTAQRVNVPLQTVLADGRVWDDQVDLWVDPPAAGSSHVSDLYPGSREWQLAVRLCGRLIADGGRTRRVKVVRIAAELGFGREVQHRHNGRSRGTRAAQVISSVMRAFETLKLANREGVFLIADDLASVADWVAAELETEPLPAPRAGATVQLEGAQP